MGRDRLIIAVVIALMAVVTYYSSTSENPLTGEQQRVALSPEQEIAPGRVMEVLASASGGSRQPEFFSTHPAPENRAERIKEAIAKQFPQGGAGESPEIARATLQAGNFERR